jgi:hypothetical protein
LTLVAWTTQGAFGPWTRGICAVIVLAWKERIRQPASKIATTLAQEIARPGDLVRRATLKPKRLAGKLAPIGSRIPDGNLTSSCATIIRTWKAPTLVMAARCIKYLISISLVVRHRRSREPANHFGGQTASSELWVIYAILVKSREYLSSSHWNGMRKFVLIPFPEKSKHPAVLKPYGLTESVCVVITIKSGAIELRRAQRFCPRKKFVVEIYHRALCCPRNRSR